MIIRIFMGAVCLIAVGSGGSFAQGTPPTGSALTPNGTSKVPNNVPDVIEPPGTHGDVIHPKVTGAPGSVLTPPNVDPGMQVARPPVPTETVPTETKKAPN